MARLISKLMDVVCAPIVNRMRRQLASEFLELRNDIQSLRRLVELPFPASLIKGELEHIEHLPLPYLRNLVNLVIVGYHSEDVARILPEAQFMCPPFVAVAAVFESNLLFLNEYHAMSLLRQIAALPVSRNTIILVPFTGAFVEEKTLRGSLHELGYAEICWLDYDRTSQTLAVSGISHPEPISCMPIMVTPSHCPRGDGRWLRASRVVLENSGDD